MNSASPLSTFILRRDLEWVYYASEARWVIHDPIRSTFFYLDQVEAAAAKMFDGRVSPSQILSQLSDRFDAKGIGTAWLESLAGKLTRSQLLLRSNAVPPTGHAPAGSFSWSNPLRFAASFMSVRIPLFNPSRLTWLLRLPAKLLFSKFATAIVLTSCVASFVMICNHLTRDGVRRLPIDLFQPSRWWIIACLMVSIKVLHELGHLLACVRWNVPSREVGVLLLSFLPNPYCDTTDAWRLPSKWKRASIAAAGIYIELIIACGAVFIWSSHPTPLVQTLAAWVMALCSVNTVLINGNPFLRYDGYYILSDLWGIPNLASRSREACAHAFRTLFQPVRSAGNRPSDLVTASKYYVTETLLILYGVISFLYRWSILITLMWVFWVWLAPLGLGFIPITIGIAVVIGMVASWIRMSDRLAAQLYRPDPIRWFRLIGFLLLLGSLLWLAASVPVPAFVRTRGFMDLANKEPVYAPVDCYVESILSSDRMSSDSIARLQSANLQLERMQTSHEKTLVEQKIELLRKTKSLSSNASLELPTLNERLSELVRKEEILDAQRQGLSPKLRDGERFLAANLPKAISLTSPLVSKRPSYFQTESMEGARLKRGTLMGWRASDDRCHVQCLISEDDFKRVRVGMKVEGMFDSRPDCVFLGTLESMGKEPIERMPVPMLGDTFFSVTRNQNGQLITEQKHYVATIAFHAKADATFCPVGSLASIRIQVDKATILEWLWRSIRLSFRMKT